MALPSVVGDPYPMAAKLRPVPKPTRPKLFVREWRKYRNDMTQERLAERVGRSVSAISQIETGDQGYSPEILAALADAFSCEVGDLFRDPERPDYQSWRVFSGLPKPLQEQALRLIKALAG